MSCFKERDERRFFFLFSLSLYLLGLGSNFVVCSSFSRLNNVAFARYARNVNARAQRRVWACCCCCCSPIYIFSCISKRERERKKLDVDACVWVRETSFLYERERKTREKFLPQNTQKKEERFNRIFFQEGRCGYLGLFFFSKSLSFSLLSLCCIVC